MSLMIKKIWAFFSGGGVKDELVQGKIIIFKESITSKVIKMIETSFSAKKRGEALPTTQSLGTIHGAIAQ